MDFTQTELPGIGKRFSFGLGGGNSLSIIIHRNGRREVYYEGRADEEPHLVFELDPEAARLVGAVLTGAYYQPVSQEALSMSIRELSLDWIPIKPGWKHAGRSIEELQVRTKTGATIVAILRGDEQLPSPGGGEKMLGGDMIMAVGRRDAVDTLRKLLD